MSYSIVVIILVYISYLLLEKTFDLLGVDNAEQFQHFHPYRDNNKLKTPNPSFQLYASLNPKQ